MPMFKKKLEHKVPMDYNLDAPFDLLEGLNVLPNMEVLDEDSGIPIWEPVKNNLEAGDE